MIINILLFSENLSSGAHRRVRDLCTRCLHLSFFQRCAAAAAAAAACYVIEQKSPTKAPHYVTQTEY